MKDYLNNTEYATRGLFNLVNIQNQDLNVITQKINKIRLGDDIPIVDDLEPLGSFNQRHGLRRLSERQKELIKQFTDELEDKEHSLQCIYGAILQIAKQGVLISFEEKTKIPKSQLDQHSGLLIVDIIFAARNQAVHYEDVSFNKKVTDIFQTLNIKYGSEFDLGNRKSRAKEVVIKVLKWNSYEDYSQTMNKFF